MTLSATAGALAALGQVLTIDLMLAGDNAVVVGLAVAGMPPEQRRQVILYGIGAAAMIRVLLALIALHLLEIVGVLFAGGALLLWVCWRMFRELRGYEEAGSQVHPAKTRGAAIAQVIAADISMSLDNILAVAGAAHNHPLVLVVGLTVSVLLTAVAASALARILERQRWIAWLGLAIVLYVSLDLIWEGGRQIVRAL
jgi:YjbE family integral membrane protein